jgi:hypothetical protein
MPRCVPLAIALVALAPSVLAQAIDPPVRRVELPWPTDSAFQTGDMRDLAVGAFVAGHPATCAAVLRGTELFVLYQPGPFEHFAPAGSLGLRCIETIPRRDGKPHRLAALSNGGLHVLALGATGFADANAGPTGAWSGAQQLDVLVVPGTTSCDSYVLGWAAAGVALAHVGDDSVVTTLATITAPPGTQVLDACLVQWVADGQPEIAIQTDIGIGVFAANGTMLAGAAGVCSDARIASLGGVAPAVVQVLEQGTTWTIRTLRPGGTFPGGVVVYGGVLVPGGTVSLPEPLVDLAFVDANLDSHADLVLSTEDSVRRVLLGTAGGPQSTANNLEVHDVATSQPVANRTPLVVTDVDQDGHSDFVIAQAGTDQLVIVPRIGEQLLEYVWNSPPAADDDRLGFVCSMGWAIAPSVTSAWPTGAGGLALRMTLPPGWTPQQVVLASAYPIAVNGTVDVDDPVLLSPAHCELTFPSNTATTATSIDVLLPFAPPTSEADRYVLELRLVEKTDYGYVNSNTPRFLTLGFWCGGEIPSSFPDALTYVTSLLTTEHEAGWWLEDAALADSVLFGETAMAAAGGPTPVPPTVEPPGNRFVGLMDIPPPRKKKKTASALPSPSAVTPLGTIVAR